MTVAWYNLGHLVDVIADSVSVLLCLTSQWTRLVS